MLYGPLQALYVPLLRQGVPRGLANCEGRQVEKEIRSLEKSSEENETYTKYAVVGRRRNDRSEVEIRINFGSEKLRAPI